MTLSLNPKMNPLIRLYELFGVPGVETEDNPNYLGVSLPIKSAPKDGAYELAQFLSGVPDSALRVLGLRFDAKQLADFAAASVSGYFQWNTIEDLIEAKKLCESCAEIFGALRSRFDTYENGAPWPRVKEDSLSVLSDLEACPTCSPHFVIDAAVDKTSLADQFLISELLASEKKISALVWYDQSHMTDSFESFQVLLEFIGEKVDEPIVLFFYQPIDPYQGHYFKILPLSRVGVQTPDMEKELAVALSGYTTDVSTDYQMLSTDHKSEERPDLGERFNIPPTLFLRQSGELASYPSHPVFTSGPLRSLLAYSIMAWLARQTDEDAGNTIFTLSLDEDNPVKVSLDFTPTDVCQNRQSIFDTQDWRDIAGRLARDIGQSAGSESFRDYWEQAMGGLTADDFTADKIFATLEAIRQRSEEKRRDPPEDIRNLTPDLSLYIYLDTVNKRLLFQLGYLNPALGLGFQPGSLQSPLNRVSVAELDEMAKRNLTAMLLVNPSNPAAKIPKLQNLENKGKALWDDMIPPDLKTAFDRLPDKFLTLFIFSEDRSFPWELIKPPARVGIAAGSKDDDNWWALRFGIARWAAGAPSPANEISITTVCCVAASSALSSAEEEIEYFESLKEDGVTVDQPKTRDELIEFLRTIDYDVIHFACHGEFNTKDPGESAIQLPDRSLLHPDDLYEGDIPVLIRKNQPLIFLNCCHSGRTGSTLVGIAGWAKRLVDWGCGAFIGCGWEVADPLAAEFAITFYQKFRDEKQSLAQAVHQAREQIREGHSQNSTWLAYYLYGNPNCSYKP